MMPHSEVDKDILAIGAGPKGLLLVNLLSSMVVVFVIINKNYRH